MCTVLYSATHLANAATAAGSEALFCFLTPVQGWSLQKSIDPPSHQLQLQLKGNAASVCSPHRVKKKHACWRWRPAAWGGGGSGCHPANRGEELPGGGGGGEWAL